MNSLDNIPRFRFPPVPGLAGIDDQKNPLCEPVRMPLGTVRLLVSESADLRGLPSTSHSEASSDCFRPSDETPHEAVGEMSAALRSYFPTPSVLSQPERVRWEQAVIGLVSALAPALVREQMTPGELKASIENLRRTPHEVESAFSVEGYIGSGVGYLVAQACYWLGLPGGSSVLAGLMMPNAALAAWRALYVLAWEYSRSQQEKPLSDQAKFFADHFRLQNRSFLVEAKRVFLANVASGWEMTNLNKRDGLKVLLSQVLPAEQRPVFPLPEYARRYPHPLTITFLSSPSDRIVAMIRSGDLEMDVTPDRSNLETLWTLMDPGFYRRQVLPHGCATFVGGMLAGAVNTLIDASQPVVACLSSDKGRARQRPSVQAI